MTSLLYLVLLLLLSCLTCNAQPVPEAPQAVTITVLSCNETSVAFTYPASGLVRMGYVIRCNSPFDVDSDCVDGSLFMQVFAIEDLLLIDSNDTHIRYEYRWFPGLIACEAYHWQVAVQLSNNGFTSTPGFGSPYPTAQQSDPAPPTEPAVVVAHQASGGPGDPCVLLALWTPSATNDCALANCTVFYDLDPTMSTELSIGVLAPENHVFLVSGLVPLNIYYVEVLCTNICGLASQRSSQVSIFLDPACT